MNPAYPLLNAAGKVVSVAPMMDWTDKVNLSLCVNGLRVGRV